MPCESAVSDPPSPCMKCFIPELHWHLLVHLQRNVRQLWLVTLNYSTLLLLGLVVCHIGIFKLCPLL